MRAPQKYSAAVTIDCHYVYPEFAAAYLRVSKGRALFVDNNTYHAVPYLLQALEREALKPEDVEYVIVTHVHLDHAGGTSRLMKACPNATLLAHPRATTHLIDPGKLVSSARKVYGSEVFEKLYGAIEPIPSQRVRSLEDGAIVPFGNTELRFLHTRGHANHHLCIHDVEFSSVYTGDAFGLRYPRLQKAGLFVLPSTSPTDFDAPEARKSVARIVATGARSVYPTHYGEVTEVREAAEQLVRHLDYSEELLEAAVKGPLPDVKLDGYCETELRKHYETYLNEKGAKLSVEDRDILGMDLKLNGQGIAHVARRRRGG